MDELRKKTLLGSVWTMVERFGYLSIQFVSNLVLARLLTPADFGTIGVMMVFIALSNILVDSGFSASLIQKKDINEQDKSTVFISNLSLAVLAYLIIFFGAPIAADYFKNPELTGLLRVLEVIVLIDAFCAIQNTLLSREMNFKLLTQIKLTAIVVAAAVAIVLAYNGFGIWSLVVQYIIYSSLRVALTWWLSRWKPRLTFSLASFKTLFGYGSKLLMSTFVAELYINFQQILIGHYYTPTDLGYYSQARQFQQIPTGTISQVINSVAFPAYSKLQSEKDKLRDMFRQNVRIVAFLNTPLMFLLAVIAKPLIILLYSSKWVGAIGYFQFLCIGFGVLLAIHQCSLSVLKALGRSDYVLKLEILKKIIGIILIVVGIHYWGIWGILYALAANSALEIFLNGYCIKSELGYGGLGQLIDLLPSIVVSLIAGGVTLYALNSVFASWGNLVAIICSTAVFVIVYLVCAWVGRVYGFSILQTAVHKVLNRKFK